MISTKGRYAVRVMLDFASQNTTGYVSLTDVSRRQDISKKYLEAIMHSLTEANLVEGIRGKNGGYRMLRTPEEYTILEILEATEGPLAPVACLKPEADLCAKAGTCMALPLWKRYDAMIHDFFANITLAQALAEAPDFDGVLDGCKRLGHQA